MYPKNVSFEEYRQVFRPIFDSNRCLVEPFDVEIESIGVDSRKSMDLIGLCSLPDLATKRTLRVLSYRCPAVPLLDASVVEVAPTGRRAVGQLPDAGLQLFVTYRTVALDDFGLRLQDGSEKLRGGTKQILVECENLAPETDV